MNDCKKSNELADTAELTAISVGAGINVNSKAPHSTDYEGDHNDSRLVARVELNGGISFSIYEGSLPLLIGRDPACGICVPQSQVSRRHCELYLEDDQLYLKDISTNGTTIGNRKLRGESVAIEGRTSVLMAKEPAITIIPSDLEERRLKSDRRERIRRQAERRENTVVVDLEQRREARRRMNRREMPRRGATG